MNENERSLLLRQSMAIIAGTVMFLYFMLLCYSRELGPTHPAPGLFIFGGLLGLCSGVIGAVDLAAHPLHESKIGMALIVEGALMIILTLIAWAAMGRLPLPAEELMAML